MSVEHDTYRHQCEVRTLLRAARDPAKGRAWVDEYLTSTSVKGRAAQLRADLNEQRSKGNHGEPGTWL